MPICAKATASASRTVMRRFSEASAIVAPPVQDFDGAFHTMVVSEASTSPAAFSRTVPSPQKQRTNSRSPSAPFTSQRAQSELFGLRAVDHERAALRRVAERPAGRLRDTATPTSALVPPPEGAHCADARMSAAAA